MRLQRRLLKIRTVGRLGAVGLVLNEDFVEGRTSFAKGSFQILSQFNSLRSVRDPGIFYLAVDILVTHFS